jgi:RNA polymerase sigma factor (sigma-70 family)
MNMSTNAGHSDVWTQLKQGNQQALLDLYNAHYIGLLNYGCKLTGNRELTNDCITQVLLRLWDCRERLPSVGNIRSYLLTCLRRELMSELKKSVRAEKYHRSLQNGMHATDLPYEEYIIELQTNAAWKEKLGHAFGKLTDREKELLRLRFFEDMSYDEMAEQCNITKRTAYNIIHAAIKTLKVELTGNRPADSRVSFNPALLMLFFFL